MKKVGAKRSNSLSVNTGELEISCLPHFPDQREYKSSEYDEYLESGDEERNMMDCTLTWSMRVLEMVASRGKVEPCLKQIWGQVRRLAEVQEGQGGE